MTRRGDKLDEGDLWRRNCAEIISLIGDDLPLGTTIAAGTYTPTLTNVANLDASTAFAAMYIRVGSVVAVAGVVNVDPTTGAGTQTDLGISLPVASNLANANELSGVAASDAVAGQSAGIFGDTTNDRATMRWLAGNTTNQPMRFVFMYRVI